MRSCGFAGADHQGSLTSEIVLVIAHRMHWWHARPMSTAEAGTTVSSSGKSALALVLSIASVPISPLIAFAQFIAAILLGMVTSEPSNPPYASIVFIFVFTGLAVLAFALPVGSLLLSRRARREIRQSDGALSGMRTALTAQVIATVVIVLLVLFEVFVALNFAGICALDGCSAAS